jgi:hypothetical protein
LKHRLRDAETHAKTGDFGIAKMLEVGFKSTARSRQRGSVRLPPPARKRLAPKSISTNPSGCARRKRRC